MTLRNSWPGPSGVTTTTDARIVHGGLVEDYVSGTPRAGIFPMNLNPIVTARSDMNVDIAAFQGVAVQFGGPILIANDGTIQLPAVLVSPASGTNYYLVYVKQDEQTSPGTDPDNLPKVGQVLSTVSFAAARATLPTGALELATVQVPSGVAATNAGGVTITQTFLYTAAEGGTVPVRNATELAAWTPADGSSCYQIDAGTVWERIGGAWVAVATTTAATVGTFGTGWAVTAGSTAYTPRIVRTGNVCTLVGAVSTSAGFSVANILTVPAAFQPPTAASRFVGTTVTSNGGAYAILMGSGVLQIPSGYGVGASVVAGVAVPLNLTWTMD